MKTNYGEMAIDVRGERAKLQQAFRAIRRRVAAARRSKLQAAYAGFLHALLRQQKDGVIAVYEESLNFQIGLHRCWYRPDFLVVRQDQGGTWMECIEVKGYMRDDARVKLQAAAKQYPSFRWTLVTQEKGVWRQTPINLTAIEPALTRKSETK